MKPLSIAPMTACLCVAAVQIAAAQADSSLRPRSEVGFALGMAHTQQLDATASPLQFAGAGYQLAARYARTSARFSVSATIDGGTRHLTASPGGAEELKDGELRLSVRRALHPATTADGFELGVDVATDAALTAHHYADPTHTISDFVVGAMTFGPAIAWSRGIAGGRAQAQLSVPAIGFVDHPYSDARTAKPGIDARFATLGTLHGIAGSFTYAPAMTSRFGLEYAYRVRVLRLVDLQPLRSVSQMLSVGVVRRFGEAPR